MAMCAGMLAGCGGGETDNSDVKIADTPEVESTKQEDQGDLVVESAGTDPNADYTVSGTVTIAVDTARATDYEALFDSLQAVYPNLNIQFDYFSHSEGNDNAAEYLSSRAAAGKLPDIVWDEAGNLPLYLTQGWVYPLDEFVAGDPDFAYIPENLISDYTYGGKLYALPHQATFEATYINLDLLEQLNLDMPALDWTVEDFESYLTAAATSEYSGIEKLFMIPTLLTNAFDPSTTLYGYNPTTRQFDMGGFIQAVRYMVRLRAIPGLEAWALRRNSSGEESDYVKKFGTSEDNAAFDKGLTLFHGVGTWEYAAAKSRWTGRNWAIWTMPQSADRPGSVPMHVDHCFMTSSCENPQAAFQVLRYITYSTEGNLARLSMYDAENAGKYATINYLYYPTTLHPDVVEKFNALPEVTEFDKFLVANIANSMRYDMFKIVPSWTEVTGNYITETVNQATDGTESMVEPTLLEAQGKANTAMDKAWADFEAKLAEVQQEFDSAHSGQ